MIRLIFLIIVVLITIYFWTTVPDAIQGLALLNHPNVWVRIAAKERHYGVWMLIVRLIISIGLTALSVWLAWPYIEKFIE